MDLCEEAHLFAAGGFPLQLHVVIKGDPLDGRLRLGIKLTDVTCVVHLAKARDNVQGTYINVYIMALMKQISLVITVFSFCCIACLSFVYSRVRAHKKACIQTHIHVHTYTHTLVRSMPASPSSTLFHMISFTFSRLMQSVEVSRSTFHIESSTFTLLVNRPSRIIYIQCT